MALFNKNSPPSATLSASMESGEPSPDAVVTMLQFMEDASNTYDAFSTLSDFTEGADELDGIAGSLKEHLDEDGVPSASALEHYTSRIHAIQRNFGIVGDGAFGYSSESISAVKTDREQRLVITNVAMLSATSTAKDVIAKVIEWFKSAYANAMQLFTKGAQAYLDLGKEVSAGFNSEAGKKNPGLKAAALKLINAGRDYGDKTKKAIEKLKTRMSSFRVGDMTDDDRTAYRAIASTVRDVMGSYRKRSSEVFKLCKTAITDTKKDVTTNPNLEAEITKLAELVVKLSGVAEAVDKFCKAKTSDELNEAKDEVDAILSSSVE